MNERNKIIITGANGFLGGVVKEHFREKGYRCIELVRNPKGYDSYQFLLEEGLRDESVFQDAEWLIHIAYDFTANNSWEKTLKINVNGSIELFKVAEKNQVKIIFISSISSFDGCRSNYGKSKLLIENYLQSSKGDNFILRLGLIYGEKAGGITKSIMSLSKFPILFLPGSNQKGYLVDYKNVLEVIESVIKKEQFLHVRKPLTIANPKAYTFAEVCRGLGARVIIPFPWQVAWLFLKLLETFGLKLRTGSDSLISLMNQNPNLDFSDGVVNKLYFTDFTLFNRKR